MAGRRLGLSITLILVASLALLAACEIEGVSLDTEGLPAVGIGLNPTGPDYHVDPDPAVTGSIERFGLDLYRQLIQLEPDQSNVFISPLSIAMTLAMTYNGAAGDTKDAMAQALGVEHLTLAQLNDGYFALIRDLTAAAGDPDGTKLNIANGIWKQHGVDFHEDFLERNRQFYGGAVRSIDFADPESVNVINNWVNVQTAGRITDLVDEIPPETQLLLANAIYFKGQWQIPFDPQRTTDRPFYPGQGSAITVAMMEQDGPFNVLETGQFIAVRLPYAEDGRLAMYLFLPDPELGLTGFYQKLNYDNWQEWLASFEKREGLVALPRFQMEYKASLNEVLKAMGMAIAFSPMEADFSRMRPVSPSDNLYIGDVKHQTFLLVDEEGTEAAAATSVEVRTTSAMLDTFRFIADRPFVVAIRDDETGALLFIGSVAYPEEIED